MEHRHSAQLRFSLEPAWPPGAWLASGAAEGGPTHVRHGASVVVERDWFGEIVWDGEYAAGGFDRTDVVYGSGGRRTDRGLVFVASGSTMDRLVCFRGTSRWWVSNSLACLLSACSATVDPLYRHYRRDFGSVIRGVDQYQRWLATSRGEVELVYHDNLLLRDDRLLVEPKPVFDRGLTTYEKYRDFLEGALRCVGDNMRSPLRPQRYEWLGTISTGFDSPTACALGRAAGLREALTFTRARGGADDDGSPIAEKLGISPVVCDRDAWRALRLPETPFLASDAKGEDVYFAGVSERLGRRVLLTGYAAGAWRAGGRANRRLRRADQSGLSLAEFRLWSDFIHLPLPPIGERSLGDQEARRLAEDLRPWASGESYDKPFCRRVLVEAGVPDDMFGRAKKAASVLMYDRRSLLSETSRPGFLNRLRSDRAKNPMRALWLRSRDLGVAAVRAAASLLRWATAATHRVVPNRWCDRVRRSERLAELAHYEPLADYLFPWASDLAGRRYQLTESAAVDGRQAVEETVQAAERE